MEVQLWETQSARFKSVNLGCTNRGNPESDSSGAVVTKASGARLIRRRWRLPGKGLGRFVDVIALGNTLLMIGTNRLTASFTQLFQAGLGQTLSLLLLPLPVEQRQLLLPVPQGSGRMLH